MNDIKKLTKLEKLTNLINSLTDEDFSDTIYDDEDDYAYYYAKSSEKMEEIEELANECLISSGGHPHFEAMGVLKELCSSIEDIHRGEYDSFGWLSGVIVLKGEKAIVFG